MRQAVRWIAQLGSFLARNHEGEPGLKTLWRRLTKRYHLVEGAQLASKTWRWVMTMGGKLVRGIGLERVRAQLGLKNLVYNLNRYVFWQKKLQAKVQGQCI